MAHGDWHCISFLLWLVFLALLRPLVPWLTSLSHGHLRVLQAQTKLNALIFQRQSWPVLPPDGDFLSRDTRDYSAGDVLHRVQAKIGVVPRNGWACVHCHYSEIVVQVASFIWKDGDDPMSSMYLELFR